LKYIQAYKRRPSTTVVFIQVNTGQRSANRTPEGTGSILYPDNLILTLGAWCEMR
jgi:hypothetical protein